MPQACLYSENCAAHVVFGSQAISIWIDDARHEACANQKPSDARDMHLARSAPTTHTLSSCGADRHIGPDTCEVKRGSNQDWVNAGDMSLSGAASISTQQQTLSSSSCQISFFSMIQCFQERGLFSKVAQGEGGCYAQRQSAGRRVSDQRETPRVGLRNRVWGQVKIPNSPKVVTAWASGGIRLAHSLRGYVCPVNVPGGIGVSR